ncbi:hypothetical protein, partial [Massilia sp. S19_KUP03_FR1]|uniref:hypothetical protein n=1 Tax=Massilia sp. S19_KUP03_FR1 TaxID=3025503 RepID=UPI002FCD8032
ALCSSQQRDEIMQVLSYAVNSSFPTVPLSRQPQVLVFVNQFLGEANYSKGFARSQVPHEKMCRRGESPTHFCAGRGYCGVPFKLT